MRGAGEPEPRPWIPLPVWTLHAVTRSCTPSPRLRGARPGPHGRRPPSDNFSLPQQLSRFGPSSTADHHGPEASPVGHHAMYRARVFPPSHGRRPFPRAVVAGRPRRKVVANRNGHLRPVRRIPRLPLLLRPRWLRNPSSVLSVACLGEIEWNGKDPPAGSQASGSLDSFHEPFHSRETRLMEDKAPTDRGTASGVVCRCCCCFRRPRSSEVSRFRGLV